MIQPDGMELNGTELNGTERNGTERNGTERNGTERNGTERNGTETKLCLPTASSETRVVTATLASEKESHEAKKHNTKRQRYRHLGFRVGFGFRVSGLGFSL